MSLTKILKAPIKLFKKEVITFLIIRRHDLGVVEDSLRYVAVKPTASISVLRQKIWILLDLPDYCEEIIVLKNGDEKEIPLTELRKGNDPQHPFILEVWLPGKKSLTALQNMLTMGESDQHLQDQTTLSETDTNNHNYCAKSIDKNPNISISSETMALNKLRVTDNKKVNFVYSDFKKSDLSSRISSTSVFRLHGRKSRDSFTNILLKIQSDLSTLSNKLSNLENRIPA